MPYDRLPEVSGYPTNDSSDHETYWTDTSSYYEYEEGKDDYTSLLKGYLVAPVNGTYQFYLRSDDGSQVFFSQTESPEDKVNTGL